MISLDIKPYYPGALEEQRTANVDGLLTVYPMPIHKTCEASFVSVMLNGYVGLYRIGKAVLQVTYIPAQCWKRRAFAKQIFRYRDSRKHVYGDSGKHLFLVNFVGYLQESYKSS